MRSVRDDRGGGGASGHGLQVSRRIGSPDMREQVRVATELVDVVTVLLPVSQTAPDKRLRRDNEKEGEGGVNKLLS